MSEEKIAWNAERPSMGTCLSGYLTTPWSFEETVARLKALSGCEPSALSDGYKCSVEFIGSFRGETFTLYDYKEDRQLNVGSRFNIMDKPVEVSFVQKLNDQLLMELERVQPVAYEAVMHYTGSNHKHRWPR